MFIEEDAIQHLIDIGFTKTQAKLYLMLLKLEDADGRTLSEKTSIPRPEVYRAIGELEKKGLVEREISSPYRFKATPLDLGLEILISQRTLQLQEIEKKTKEVFQKLKSETNNKVPKHQHKLIKIEGKQRLMQIIQVQHDGAQRSVDILSTLARWLQILHFCFENYAKALDRGVKYRVVLDALESEVEGHENIQALLKKRNFNLRLSQSPLQTNAAIFDQKEVTVNFFPSESLASSPLIWTNHPSFISMCQDHFETIWKTAKEGKLANIT